MGRFDSKFGSAKQDWETPQDLFDLLNREFGFETDLAATASNAKCPRFFTEQDNGLKQEWRGTCWVNPPYGDTGAKLGDWVKKAYEDSIRHGTTVVMLIPARTNTGWWHRYCMNAAEIRFICGRVCFVGGEHGLPQPLAIVIFRKSDVLAVKSLYLKGVGEAKTAKMAIRQEADRFEDLELF